jgi:hypothetical protein
MKQVYPDIAGPCLPFMSDALREFRHRPTCGRVQSACVGVSSDVLRICPKELIDVAGRVTIEAMLKLSAQQVAGGPSRAIRRQGLLTFVDHCIV